MAAGVGGAAEATRSRPREAARFITKTEGLLNIEGVTVSGDIITAVNFTGQFKVAPIIVCDIANVHYPHAWEMADPQHHGMIGTMMYLMTYRRITGILKMAMDQASPTEGIGKGEVAGIANMAWKAMTVPDDIHEAANGGCVDRVPMVTSLLRLLAGRISVEMSRTAAANPQRGMALALTSASKVECCACIPVAGMQTEA